MSICPCHCDRQCRFDRHALRSNQSPEYTSFHPSSCTVRTLRWSFCQGAWKSTSFLPDRLLPARSCWIAPQIAECAPLPLSCVLLHRGASIPTPAGEWSVSCAQTPPHWQCVPPCARQSPRNFLHKNIAWHDPAHKCGWSHD